MITKKIYLYFPKSETEKPIVYRLVKDYDLIVNIFRAKVTPEEEGYLSLEVTGTQENIDRAYAFLGGFDVVIHAGINVGLLPVTGTTIPFMSSGGSHLVAEFAALGVVTSLARFGRTAPRGRESENEYFGG